MTKKIKLGSKVRCIISGFEGIAVHRTEFMNGCVQYGVVPPCVSNKLIDEIPSLDVQSLEVVKGPSKKKKPKTKKVGGATTKGVKMRGC